MRILVVSSCTGDKARQTEGQLTIADFEKGREHVQQREQSLREHMLPCEQMYTGQQHVRLMAGIRACSSQALVDLYILSAGYGLIQSGRCIAPYNCTFQGMKGKAIDKLADQLDIPTSFRMVAAAECDLTVLLLGAEYLRACRLDTTIRLGSPTVAFCSGASAGKLPGIQNLRAVPLPHSGSKNIWLKGEYASRLLRQISCGAVNPSEVLDSKFDLLGYLGEA